MQSKLVADYVRKRINETRHELAQARKETTMSYEQYDAIAERIARRIAQARSKQPTKYYEKRPDFYKGGYQGQYADQLLRESGLYEHEWKRLHGEQ